MILKTVLLFSVFASTLSAEPPTIDSKKISSYLGYKFWEDWQQHLDTIQLDLPSVIEGLHSAKNGEPSPFTTEEEFEKKLFELQKNLWESHCKNNLIAANRFLEILSKNPQTKVVVKDKIYYIVQKEGTGDFISEFPLIRYTFSQLCGTELKKIVEQKEPMKILLSDTISGFRQGLKGAKEGEIRTIYIHPDLAHGESARLDEPNRLLVFEVEVIPENI